ncbi:supporter of activation of yellow protein-like isoform X2 [Ceratina calcarata]|uniref:Supporter of activation of yellow protein-like isoform X2 n=1 Tax=Ceratina calcarata TaxID=156304 RepID=A0AAJ7JF57_9HYME|nr:supporter of activation of yellow protein-like isoform X2 [Ceratina calcarata]
MNSNRLLSFFKNHGFSLGIISKDGRKRRRRSRWASSVRTRRQESRKNERPKRACRSQKSYAPPKRGRGRGGGKRKLDNADSQLSKKARIEQDLSAIEASTTAVITLDDPGIHQEPFVKSPELYKALKQPAMDSKIANSPGKVDETMTRGKNDGALASETIVNEESQESVLSTTTTKSEKVKVKNRRMEINFDPDEGPFTVDKLAEYEWPLDHKGETFMIQEQISQYLGVKSFKRKYPYLKRRVVDMEERNYLRENGLVSEAMCEMGLTAICSSEALDVMCCDFPHQYEECRKHMSEKRVKEHFKKQKELTAAANAEKNRIDLAEMAVQSALSWNISLNKARRESRKCSLDIQTFTIHVPKKQQKVDAERRIGHYPIALFDETERA